MPNLTLKQAVDDFIFMKSATCVQKTIEYYEQNLGYFISWYSNEKQILPNEIMLKDITVKDLNDYLINLRNRTAFENHPIHNKNENKLSNNTIRTYQRALRVFLKYCFEENYIENDIGRKFKFIRELKNLVLPLYEYEVDDIDAMFNPKCAQGNRNLCIVHLMLDAGLRSGEVVELTVNDVDFSKGIIYIRDSKFNKSRVVPMCLKLKQYMHKYYILHRGISEDQTYTSNIKNERFFLEVRTRKPITSDVIRCLFSRIKRTTEISRIYPHLLRHTFATSYILGGGNLESLRILLGHSDIVTTQKYVHLAQTYQIMHSEVYKLDRMFFKTYY